MTLSPHNDGTPDRPVVDPAQGASSQGAHATPPTNSFRSWSIALGLVVVMVGVWLIIVVIT